VKYMLRNMWLYADGLPHFLLFQYKQIAYIPDRYIFPFFILLIPGWICLMKQERDLPLISFAFVILVSTLLSAAIIFGSDGPRDMHVTHPFIAMIFATGFAAPLSLRASDDRPLLSVRTGVGAIGALMFASLLGPPMISHAVRWATAFDPH